MHYASGISYQYWSANEPVLVAKCPSYLTSFQTYRTHCWKATCETSDPISSCTLLGVCFIRKELVILPQSQCYCRAGGTMGLTINLFERT